MWSKLFSIWFYALALVYSLAVIPLFALCMVLSRPFVRRRQRQRLLRQLIKIWARILVKVLPFPFIRVRSRDLSDGQEAGPFVYVSNHRTTSDAFLMSVLPGEGVQVVNIWPFRIPLIGYIARKAGYLSIRQMAYDDFKARVGAYLAQGVSVVAFPEGTRSASRRMGQFHGALFRVCLAVGVTIVPVCVMGNEDKPRRGSLLLRPGVITVHRLPGIPAASYREKTSYELKNHVRKIMQEHIRNTEGNGDGTVQGSGNSVPAV